MGNTMAYPKCYNEKCNNVFTLIKESCQYSDTCPEFMAVGFGSAKKKTNFDHIKEMSVDEFAKFIYKFSCPTEDSDVDKSRCNSFDGCLNCWLSWLNYEYND